VGHEVGRTTARDETRKLDDQRGLLDAREDSARQLRRRPRFVTPRYSRPGGIQPRDRSDPCSLRVGDLRQPVPLASSDSRRGWSSALQLLMVHVDEAVMRRYLGTGPLVVVLALAAGIACYLWQIHDLGRDCGYASGFGLPSFPVGTALAVLVGTPALLTGASALIERRSRPAVAGFMLLAAVLAATAFGSALVAFFVSRGCFK
jgi:hypothetical protein